MSEPIGVVYRDTDARSPVEFARRAESLGYESLWLSEGWGRNTATVLAEMATQTDTITLGTAILNVFSRSPALLAATGSSLQRIADGRFVLGLGASHPELVEGLHGVSYERPVTRVRETVELIDAFTNPDGEDVSYDGDVFSVDGYPPLDSDFPVYNAGLGPRNRRVTGELCDGWMPNQVPVGRLESDFELVAEAATDAGRSPEDVAVTPWIPAVVHDDEATAVDLMRRAVAGYVARFSAYQQAVAASHPVEAEAIASAYEDGGLDGAADAVSDDLVHEMGIVGTPSLARDRLAAIVDSTLVDVPILSVPRWVESDAVERTVEELAPRRLPE